MAVAAAFAVSGSAEAAVPKTHSAMVHDVVDHHVIPRVEALASVTGRLSSDLTAVCAASASDAPGKLVTAKQSFAETVKAWGGVEFLRFGPMGEAGRVERFAFWPDTRGIVFRQLPPLLAKRDRKLLEPGELGRQSAAVQGLHALELLLYDDETPVMASDDEGRYRCAFAAAIGSNMAQIATDLVAAWEARDGWRRRMYAPGSDNGVYPEPADAARDLVRALLTGLQLVQERQIRPRYDTLLGVAKTPRLPFERSGLGLVYLEAGLASLKDFSDRFGIASHTPQDKAWMRGWMARAFDTLVRDAPKMPIKPAVPADPASIDKQGAEITLVRQMRFHLNGLRHMIGRELAPAAELSIGFNELDGD
jgi:predicted lipoprotein